jgi:hypothetical protein
VQEVARRVFALPDVKERPSAISVPGARALWLQDDVPTGPQEAFMTGREFVHIHPMGTVYPALGNERRVPARSESLSRIDNYGLRGLSRRRTGHGLHLFGNHVLAG